MKRFMELFDKKFITLEELKEIEKNKEVKNIINLGEENSIYYKKQHISVTLKNWEEYSFYL